MYIIQFEEGVYKADWCGDPGRTVLKSNAQQYHLKDEAETDMSDTLGRISSYRKFPNAQVIEI